MTQPGRKSATSRALPRVDGRRPRIKPPPELADRARSLWLETVGDCKPEHFQPSDAPLLAVYCAALVEREVADAHLDEEGRILVSGKLNPWISVRRESLKTISMLSMRLRLCPQARQHKAQTSEQALSCKALQACLDQVLNDTSDPGRSEQVRDFLAERDWLSTAEFCCYGAQRRALNLKPWEVPPGSGPNTPEGAKLLAHMLKAGISRYDPDPLGALRAARRRGSVVQAEKQGTT